MVVQKVLTFLPKFEIYKNGSYIGCLSKEFSFLTPHYNIDYNGWHIDGTIMEWDYSILDRSGYSIARVSKELFHMTDTYVIDVQDLGNGTWKPDSGLYMVYYDSWNSIWKAVFQANQIKARACFYDFMGHYSRPDVAHIELNHSHPRNLNVTCEEQLYATDYKKLQEISEKYEVALAQLEKLANKIETRK